MLKYALKINAKSSLKNFSFKPSGIVYYLLWDSKSNTRKNFYTKVAPEKIIFDHPIMFVVAPTLDHQKIISLITK